jgi:hypothetical protein
MAQKKPGRMTAEMWEKGYGPHRLLNYLRRRRKEKPSGRKLRLLAAACCRRLWDIMADERSRQAVETLERYVDGLASEAEWQAARNAAHGAFIVAIDRHDPGRLAINAVFSAVYFDPLVAARSCVALTSFAFRGKAQVAERRAQSGLVRDIFGNPFQASILDSTCCSAAVRRIAEQMYNSRDFSAAPILADALEEAGCTDAVILRHLRDKGPHVRGCWVVDLILGKS